jgi:hypothetical protein
LRGVEYPKFPGDVCLIKVFLAILVFLLSSPAWAGSAYNYWVENQGSELFVFDNPSGSHIICGELRKNERARLLKVLPGYYKIQLRQSDCNQNVGYVVRSGADLKVLRTKKSHLLTPKASPSKEKAQKKELSLPAEPEPEGSIWDEKWGIENRFYASGRGGMGFGLKRLSGMTMAMGVEVGYIPSLKLPLTLTLPITYFMPSEIDVGSGLSLDVHLLLCGIGSQYRIPFGESPFFAQARADVGMGFAFGSFSQSLSNVSDSSVYVRPGFGVGYHEKGSPYAYLVEGGLNYFIYGFGFQAMGIEGIFTVQYWF